MSAIIGELSIVTSTGVTLTAQTDIRLAWLWAEAEVNAEPTLPAWGDLTYGQRCGHVGEALSALRIAYAGHAQAQEEPVQSVDTPE